MQASTQCIDNALDKDVPILNGDESVRGIGQDHRLPGLNQADQESDNQSQNFSEQFINGKSIADSDTVNLKMGRESHSDCNSLNFNDSVIKKTSLHNHVLLLKSFTKENRHNSGSDSNDTVKSNKNVYSYADFSETNSKDQNIKNKEINSKNDDFSSSLQDNMNCPMVKNERPQPSYEQSMVCDLDSNGLQSLVNSNEESTPSKKNIKKKLSFSESGSKISSFVSESLISIGGVSIRKSSNSSIFSNPSHIILNDQSKNDQENDQETESVTNLNSAEDFGKKTDGDSFENKKPSNENRNNNSKLNIEVKSIKEQGSFYEENSSIYEVSETSNLDFYAEKSESRDCNNLNNNQEILESRFEDDDGSEENLDEDGSYDDNANLILSDDDNDEDLASYKMETLGGPIIRQSYKSALSKF